MAWVAGTRNVLALECPSCTLDVCFEKSDMQHYRHDVEGNNVYVDCPNCGANIPVYKQAAAMGWVEADPY